MHLPVCVSVCVCVCVCVPGNRCHAGVSQDSGKPEGGAGVSAVERQMLSKTCCRLSGTTAAVPHLDPQPRTGPCTHCWLEPHSPPAPARDPLRPLPSSAPPLSHLQTGGINGSHGIVGRADESVCAKGLTNARHVGGAQECQPVWPVPLLVTCPLTGSSWIL